MPAETTQDIATLIAEVERARAGSTEQWLVDGQLVYVLEHDSWHKGVERFRNRFSAHVAAGPSLSNEQAEAIARRIVTEHNAMPALLAYIRERQAREQRLVTALDEALNLINGEHFEDRVIRGLIAVRDDEAPR